MSFISTKNRHTRPLLSCRMQILYIDPVGSAVSEVTVTKVMTFLASHMGSSGGSSFSFHPPDRSQPFASTLLCLFGQWHQHPRTSTANRPARPSQPGLDDVKSILWAFAHYQYSSPHFSHLIHFPYSADNPLCLDQFGEDSNSTWNR